MPFVFAMGNDITFMLDEIKPCEQTHQVQDNFPIARQTSQDYTCIPTVFESSCEGFGHPIRDALSMLLALSQLIDLFA